MSEAEHHDSSHNWLTFFFVCFAITVLGIGLFAAWSSQQEKPAEEPAGGHGMLSPDLMKKLPYHIHPVA